MTGFWSGLTVGALCGVIVAATVAAAMRREDPYSLPRPVTEYEVERLAAALYENDMAAWDPPFDAAEPFALTDDREAYLRHARVCLGFLTASDSPEGT
jgi:hypothetical protein